MQAILKVLLNDKHMYVLHGYEKQASQSTILYNIVQCIAHTQDNAYLATSKTLHSFLAVLDQILHIVSCMPGDALAAHHFIMLLLCRNAEG